MILNPVIVGGSSAEPEETPDLYIELSARIMAATKYIEMRKPDGKAQRLHLGSAVDTRVTYHLFVYQYGTYTFAVSYTHLDVYKRQVLHYWAAEPH